MIRPRDTRAGARSPRARLSLCDRAAGAILAAACACAVAVMAGVAAPTGAAAASGPVVTVHPASGIVSSYFHLTARPGARVRAGDVVIRNPSAGPVTVTLDPVAGETASTLGSTYAIPSRHPRGPALWLRLASRRVTLASGATASVPLWLDLPRAARAGDYLSGVSVEALGQDQQASVSKQLAVASVERYGIGVEVSVPGPRHPLIRFSGAAVVRQPGSLAFLLYARNLGNVVLKGAHGETTISRAGHTVVHAPLGPGTFVTGTAIAYPVLARGQLPQEGTVYHVSAVLHYPGGVAYLSTDVRFGRGQATVQQNYGGPKLPHPLPLWLWILIVAAALAALATIVYVVRRRRRPLGRSAGLRVLRRAIAASVTTREPVSIALVETSGPERRSSTRLAKAVRERLRPADVICDMGAGGLLIILPRTRAEAATALAEDLAEHLARSAAVDYAPAVGTATSRGPTQVAYLIARAKECMRPGFDQPSFDALLEDAHVPSL